LKKVEFCEWSIALDDNLFAVVDNSINKMVIMEGTIELSAVLWVDEKGLLQIKPTWDCVITIDDKNKNITIRHSDFLRSDQS
jgi:hypothetical protein